MTEGPISYDDHPLCGRLTDLVMPQECDRVTNRYGLGYWAWHEDAEKRMKAGEKQVRCCICCKWKWSVERCNLFKGE